MIPREPQPDYALRCFVLARAARLFFHYAAFFPGEKSLTEPEYRIRVRDVLSQSPRIASREVQRVAIPGYGGLRDFSRHWEHLLKAECGEAWRSYVLRSHWRMVFPITRRHQDATAEGLQKRIAGGIPPLVHLVRFPQLTINHGMLVYEVEDGESSRVFRAYDPNIPDRPAQLTYDLTTRTFSLPANPYWAGGSLDLIEIYRSFWL